MSLEVRPIIHLSSKDILSLNPGHLIERQTINAYLRIIERRNLYFNEKYPTVFAFDAEFLIDLQNGTNSNVIDIFSYDILLLPIRLPYWALIVVDVSNMKVKVFDSLKSSWIREKEIVIKFLCNEAIRHGNTHKSVKSNWESLRDSECSLRDEKEAMYCGLFVCYFAEVASRRKDVEGQVIDLKSIRKVVEKALFQGKLDKEFPRAIDPPFFNKAVEGKHGSNQGLKSVQNILSPAVRPSHHLNKDRLDKEMIKQKMKESFPESWMYTPEEDDGASSTSISYSPFLSVCASEELINKSFQNVESPALMLSTSKLPLGSDAMLKEIQAKEESVPQAFMYPQEKEDDTRSTRRSSSQFLSVCASEELINKSFQNVESPALMLSTCKLPLGSDAMSKEIQAKEESVLQACMYPQEKEDDSRSTSISILPYLSICASEELITYVDDYLKSFQD